VIKEYFANYFLHMSNVTFDLERNSVEVHENRSEPWRVTVVDTGDETMTGGRVKRALPFVGSEDFCMTYGDGVSDVDVRALVAFHAQHHELATVTAYQPPGRFGSMNLDEDGRVHRFEEKPQGDGAWINAGFFVLSPKVGEYIQDDSTIWERDPMEALAKNRQLKAYFHRGFWHAMDTMRDKAHLEELWATGKAPWKTWGAS